MASQDSTQLKPAPKRIIITCDGTWQSAVSGKQNIPSNVTRLCRYLAKCGRDDKGKVWQQIVYYDAGVGTGALWGLESFTQGLDGGGLAENVIEAYNFLSLNYNPGDEIFFFGFSRGAFTVRSVAGLVTQIGILPPLSMIFFPQIWELYKANTSGKPFKETDAWNDYVNGNAKKSPPLEPNGQHGAETGVKIKVIGVWDTVGSLGIPNIHGWDLSSWRTQYGFHNTVLSPDVENAFQALALDERRSHYSPTLWFLPTGISNTAKTTTNLSQVWFPGMHINIGGGSTDGLSARKGDLEQIANITFAWMVDNVQPFLAFDDVAIYTQIRNHSQLIGNVPSTPNISATLPQPQEPGWIEWARSWVFAAAQAPSKISYAGGDFVESYSGIMKIPGQLVRSPGQYKPEGTLDTDIFGATNEQIHPSIWHRMEVRPKSDSKERTYQPKALENFERVRVESGFEWVKVVNGDVLTRLPEFKISFSSEGSSVMERFLMDSEPAASFLRDLDSVYGNENKNTAI